MKTMDMLLIHGRTDPNANMDEWGFNGPTLHGIVAMHATYQSTFNLYFASRKAAAEAHRLTGWEYWDDAALAIKFHEDLIETSEDRVHKFYYGDWELQTESGERYLESGKRKRGKKGAQ